jgi:hypothetical protein
MREPSFGTRAEAGLRKRGNWWSYLEAHSDQPEFQELIRREIYKGTIRVTPGQGGRVRVILASSPNGDPDGDRPPLRNSLSSRRERESSDVSDAVSFLGHAPV